MRFVMFHLAEDLIEEFVVPFGRIAVFVKQEE